MAIFQGDGNQQLQAALAAINSGKARLEQRIVGAGDESFGSMKTVLVADDGTVFTDVVAKPLGDGQIQLKTSAPASFGNNSFIGINTTVDSQTGFVSPIKSQDQLSIGVEQSTGGFGFIDRTLGKVNDWIGGDPLKAAALFGGIAAFAPALGAASGAAGTAATTGTGLTAGGGLGLTGAGTTAGGLGAGLGATELASGTGSLLSSTAAPAAAGTVAGTGLTAGGGLGLTAGGGLGLTAGGAGTASGVGASLGTTGLASGTGSLLSSAAAPAAAGTAGSGLLSTAMDWAKANPLQVASLGLTAAKALSGSNQPTSSTTSTSIDPEMKAAYLQNLAEARSTAAGLGPRQFAAFPEYTTNMVQRYMNPFEETVVQNALGDIERQRQIQMAQEGAQATAARAFGGSRQGVQRALVDEAALRQTGTLGAQLRQQGFAQAQNLALQQEQLRQAYEQQKLDATRNLGLERLNIASGALGLQPANLGSTQTTPIYRNTSASALGGALTGATLGRMIGGTANPEYATYGALGGGVIGLL